MAYAFSTWATDLVSLFFFSQGRGLRIGPVFFYVSHGYPTMFVRYVASALRSMSVVLFIFLYHHGVSVLVLRFFFAMVLRLGGRGYLLSKRYRVGRSLLLILCLRLAFGHVVRYVTGSATSVRGVRGIWRYSIYRANGYGPVLVAVRAFTHRRDVRGFVSNFVLYFVLASLHLRLVRGYFSFLEVFLASRCYGLVFRVVVFMVSRLGAFL